MNAFNSDQGNYPRACRREWLSEVGGYKTQYLLNQMKW